MAIGGAVIFMAILVVVIVILAKPNPKPKPCNNCDCEDCQIPCKSCDCDSSLPGCDVVVNISHKLNEVSVY